MKSNTADIQSHLKGKQLKRDKPKELYKWIILTMTTATQTGVSFISQGVAAIAPFLEMQLNLTKAQVGLLAGAVNIGTTFTSALAGQAVDKFGEKLVLVIGSVLTGLSIILASQSSSFAMLLPLLLFTGFWSASSTPAGSKAIMSWFPSTYIGTAIGIRQTGVAAGGFLAALILPIIALDFEWNWSLIFAGFVSIFLGLLCIVIYREPQSLKLDSKQDTGTKKQDSTSFLSILRNRNILMTNLAAISFVAAQFIIVTYLQLFLRDRRSLSIDVAFYFLAIAQLAGVAGRIIWGWISDRFFWGARKPVLMMIGVIASIMSLSMIFIQKQTPIWLVVVLVAIFGFTAIGWNGIWVAMISEFAGKDRSGTALGIGLTIVQLGVLFFPPLFGLFVDQLHSYNYSWLGLFFILLLGIMILSNVKESNRKN